MNSNLIPLLYPLQPGYLDADKWIDQLLNSPGTIYWQAAFTKPIVSDTIGACIYDRYPATGIKYYQKFFTLSAKLINKVVPSYSYVYQFEYEATYEPEDVMVMEVRNSDGTMPFRPQIAILK